MSLNKFEHEAFIKYGFTKENLEHGAYYLGYGRSIMFGIARWNKNDSLFYYVRYKFGSYFVERQCSPEDACDGFSYFQPHRKILNPPYVIPLEEPFKLDQMVLDKITLTPKTLENLK